MRLSLEKDMLNILKKLLKFREHLYASKYGKKLLQY